MISDAEKPQMNGNGHKHRDQNARKENKFDPFEKYPLYEVKPVQWNPPASYFSHKKVVEPEPEYIPPPKAPSRKVDPEKLSKNQKNLAGKDLFEKDLEIIKKRNESRPFRRSNSVKKAKPPDMFFRDEAERQQNLIKLEEYDDKLKKRRKKRDVQRQRNFESEKRRIDEIALEKEREREQKRQLYEEAKQKEMKKRKEYIESIRVQNDRPTKASILKEEQVKKKLMLDGVEDRRQKLNKDIRRATEAENAKKINDILYELNPKINNESRMHIKKVALKKNENNWKKWLNLTEQTNKLRETMLERIYLKSEL